MPSGSFRDPSSIAFAQVAEEHRRAGGFEAAVRICRAGLTHHPGFLSARVTLGHSLLALDQIDEAAAQLGEVLRAAPDHLAALRGLGEIHRRRGESQEALHHYRAALALVPRDRELSACVAALEHTAAASAEGGLATIPGAHVATADVASGGVQQDSARAGSDPQAVARLRAWLGALLADRARRARGGA